ncbi:MAG: hypothetical protein QME96_17105 [Myxococcota bacterium]|nr:hypothetical protein [Myxococcota bacterium]
MKADMDRLVGTLREKLHEAFMARYHGAAYARIARAVGYADGYMQAILDAGLATQKEMIALVVSERQKALHTDHPACGDDAARPASADQHAA